MPIELPEMLNVPPKLLPVITDFNSYRYFLIEGGRGSGKTQSVARLLLYLASNYKLRIFCGRETQNSIDESVYTVLRDVIDQYELPYDAKATRLTQPHTESQFRFKGFREQGAVNIKGMEGVDILWIDEAQAIQKATLDVLIPTIRKDNAKLFFTMNRYMRDDAVYEFLAGRSDCLHIHIDYFENSFCPLSTKVEAENLKNKSLREYNHIYLGIPLESADDYLFNYEKLYAALEVNPEPNFPYRQRVMAFDFAAQGNDQCVATVLDRVTNQHWKLAERIPWDENDSMVSVGKIVDLIGTYQPDVSILDVGGMGHVVWNRLQEIGVKIERFDGASTENVDKKHYVNARANGYYELKDWFDKGLLQIEERDKEVIKQLEKIKMKFRSDGRRLLQAKVDMKKDLTYSPDDADSLMMAVWAAKTYLGNANSYANTNKTATITRKGNPRRGSRRASSGGVRRLR